MIKVENLEVLNFEGALRGMRNPLESWDKSDSYYRFLIRKVSKKKLKEMQKFFRTINEKKLVLKALEYVMDKEDFSYYEVYSPMKVIKKVKKLDKDHGVYNFVKKMQFL